MYRKSYQIFKQTAHEGQKPDGRPVYNSTGRVCGSIVGDTLVKDARASHMLRKPLGWAWDSSILEQAQHAGVKAIVVHDTDNGVMYSAPLEEFLHEGVKINRGFGDQIVLPLKYWKQQHPGDSAQARLF